MSLGKRASEYIAKTAQSRGMANENKRVSRGTNSPAVNAMSQVSQMKKSCLKGPTNS